MAVTVTATMGGSTANGLNLRVVVLTGAAAAGSQTGASSNTQFASTATWTQSITTTQTGSRVYGAMAPGNVLSSATASGVTTFDQISDGTNGETYFAFKATSLTGTPGATTLGYTGLNPASSGPFAMLEVLASGSLAEDSSGSGAFNSTLAATTVTTPSFTPPGGSLLVAMVASDGGTGVTTFTVSDTGGGYSWSEKVKNNPSGGDYAGIWIASVPGAAASGTAPKRMTVARRQAARARIGPDACAGDGNAGPALPPVVGTPQPPQYLIYGRSSRLAETYRFSV